MNVKTPSGDKQWKNVEITGYAKVVEANPPNDSLDWYARGIRHNNNVPCEGTALHGDYTLMVPLNGKKKYGILVATQMNEPKPKFLVIQF